MRILIDIGHPAHVHYFKNYYSVMKGLGHEFIIFARDREFIFALLNQYGMPFISRGRGSKSILGKIGYLIYVVPWMFIRCISFRPDVVIGFSSIYSSIVAFLYRAKNIVLDDTEHAKFEQMLYKPFATVIFSPICFKKEMGNRHRRVNATTESLYLLPNYYRPDSNLPSKLGVKRGEKYCIIRFIAWNASHDIGQSGWSDFEKEEIIRYSEKFAKVLISSEGQLPLHLGKYKINLEPHEMHDALYFASFFVGESGTMATEAAFLGTPSIMFNSLSGYLGYVDFYKEAKLLFTPKNIQETVDLIELFAKTDKSIFLNRAKKIQDNSADFTTLLLEETLGTQYENNKDE